MRRGVLISPVAAVMLFGCGDPELNAINNKIYTNYRDAAEKCVLVVNMTESMSLQNRKLFADPENISIVAMNERAKCWNNKPKMWQSMEEYRAAIAVRANKNQEVFLAREQEKKAVFNEAEERRRWHLERAARDLANEKADEIKRKAYCGNLEPSRGLTTVCVAD